MLGYECGTVGTDMVRKKASDSSCRQRSGSDNAVSSLKILWSSLCHLTGEFTSSFLTHHLEQSRRKQTASASWLHCSQLVNLSLQKAMAGQGLITHIYLYADVILIYCFLYTGLEKQTRNMKDYVALEGGLLKILPLQK